MEWNALVKPIVYVLEIILGAVVAFGTADQLIFSVANTSGNQSHQHCALNNSMSACVSVIVIGSICFIGALVVLWMRLVAAFTTDPFAGEDEAVYCCILSFGWLIVAIIISHNFKYSFPKTTAAAGKTVTRPADVLIMRNTITAFSWLNIFLYIASAAIAFFVPSRDVLSASQFPNARTAAGQMNTQVLEKHPVDCSDEVQVHDDDDDYSIGGSTGEEVDVPESIKKILLPGQAHRPLTVHNRTASNSDDRATSDADSFSVRDVQSGELRKRRQDAGVASRHIVGTSVADRHSAPPVME